MLYQYTATNEDSTLNHGTIDAPSIEQARQILTDRGLDISELKEASRVRESVREPETQPTLRTTFAFEGSDRSGVIRRGTLQADSKYEAFEQLRESQGLQLSMLSPVGITPQYHDRDLQNWQNRDKKSVSTPQDNAQIPVVKKQIGFVGIPSTKEAGQPSNAPQTMKKDTPPVTRYTSILSTLRLYAGWLLAWYAIFVALGYYVHVRALTIVVPFVEAFYLSSLMFSVTVATFLFLALSSIHRTLKGALITGVVLALSGVALFILVRMNMPV